MPAYEVSVQGSLKASRTAVSAPTDGLVRVRPGRRFTLDLQPETTVDEPVEVRAFLGRDGAWRPWAIEPQIAPGGAVRIAARVGKGFPAESGRWQVAVMVGRRGAVPDAGKLTSTPGAGTPEAAPWVLLRVEIEVEPIPLPEVSDVQG